MRRKAVGFLFVVVAACSTGDGSVSTTTAPPVTSTTTTAATTTTTAATTTTTTAPDPRTPVLLDYSPTVSDIGALVFVASHPDLRLVAVTLPGTGESYCEEGVAHTRGVLELLDLGDVPVACGPDDPLTGWNAFPTSWRVAASGAALPEAAPNDTRGAPELIADTVTGSDVPVEILAVAPLTNLAMAFEADPALAGAVGGITIMGGAVDVPGNVIRNDVAEWNIWVDPTAAGVVFASGAPMTLVPLDATNHLPANEVFFEALDGSASSAGSALVRDLIAGDESWLAGGFFFWDELAAAVLADESIVDFETRTLVVDDELRENKGWTREDPSGSEIRVAVSAVRLAFEQLYLDTLIGSPAELGYLEATPAEEAYFEELERLRREAIEALDVILVEAAAELGDEAGDDFFVVIAAALPAVFDGPWPAQIEAMEDMAVPPSIMELHGAWLDALRSFAAAEGELLEALESGDAESFQGRLVPLIGACEALEGEAARRLLVVDLEC